MPHFETYNLVKWLHFVTMAIGGGAAVVALLLSGFEDEREDLRGLAATVWKKAVAWPFRLALVLGIVLLVMKFMAHEHPFAARYLHFKLVLVFAMVAVSEMTPKALAQAKRGAALLTLLFFLLTTFVVLNKEAFGRKLQPIQEPMATLQAAP